MKERGPDTHAADGELRRCPPPIRLREFAEGLLPPEHSHRLFTHLRKCRVCGHDLGDYCRFFSLKEAQLRAGEQA